MPLVWKPLYLQILEKLPSNPGHRGDHLPHSRVKHEKAVVGTRGAGSLRIPRACQTADRRDSDEGTPLKELCSGCALSNSQSGRWPTIATWTSFLCKSPAEIQYVGVLSIAAMQAFSETEFEYATVTNRVYNCSTTDLKANGSHPPNPRQLHPITFWPGLGGFPAGSLQPRWPMGPGAPAWEPDLLPVACCYLHCCLSLQSGVIRTNSAKPNWPFVCHYHKNFMSELIKTCFTCTVTWVYTGNNTQQVTPINPVMDT